ncbi:tetratricopeptide repeat protein, partial [candidate division WOR-3 bacterium]|nr:tetratricopeptide repeat protein [candidate division WOR-3 bacterium]
KKIGREYFDDLTGLYNRRYLISLVSGRLKETQGNNIPLSIVLIDLDHFKNVNDTYGHTRGDVVLKEFALFLKSLLRQGDTVFRYGGDEFICMLSSTDYGQAVKISQRFIEQCRVREFSQIRLTMSIGIASSPENARDWQELFDIADRNLYSAKRHGRDRVGVYERERKGLLIPTDEIIGRDEEISKVRGFIDPIFEGGGGTVCISGEIGVGKTRLVHEVVKDSNYRDIQFFGSNLSATTKSIPYYPFREIIRGVINREGVGSVDVISGAYRIELMKIVPELSGELRGMGKQVFMTDKFRLFEGVRRFLALQCSACPIFVCLDNVHWADEGSLELLHYLVRVLRESGVFFFLVYRIEEIKDSPFQDVLRLMSRERLYERVDLKPLEVSGVARMLSLIIDGIPSVDLTDYIFNQTGGNPFFIEELMKSLEESGAIEWDGSGWRFDRGKGVVIPYSVEGVVERKLGMLDSEACGLLEYAAVLGREFDFSFLRDITNMNEGHLFDLMDDIIGMQLLEEGGKEHYCFTEDMIREVIYSKISGVKLKRYHQVVGERLLSLYEGRTEGVVEELANHFHRSGDLERAIEYSVVAGDRAKDAYANRDAIRFYDIAIECLAESEAEEKEVKEIEYLKKRAAVLDLVAENEKAVEDLEEAIKKAKVLGERKWEASCLIALCKVYFAIAQYKDTIELAEIALKIYRELNDKEGEARGLNCIGIAHWYLGEFQSALELYQTSLKIAKDIGNRKLEAMTLGNCSIIFWNLDDYSKALEYYKRSLKITKETGDSETEGRALNNIGLIYGTLGEDSKALEYYKRSLKISREIGDRKVEASTLNNIGIIYVGFGIYEKALKYYMDSLKLTKEIGVRKVEAMSLNNIGILYSNLGEYSKALEYCANSLEISREINDRQTEAESLVGIGDSYLEIGDLSSAEKYYKKALKIARKIKLKSLIAEVLISFTSLYFNKNDFVKVKERLNKILSLTDKLDSRNIKAKALSLSGRLYTKEKRWDEAKYSFGESISIFKGLKRKFELAQVHYYQGLMFAESDDKVNAKKSFKLAVEIFKKIGAKGWIKKIERRKNKK